MRAYQLDQFGLDNLRLVESEPQQPGPNEVLLEVRALSLNYRDVLVVSGQYNPQLKLPATPVSDGAGVVLAAGGNVTRCKPGDEVVSHFVSGWMDGPFRQEYAGTTLGLPAAGLAAEQVLLPADAVVPIPAVYTLEEAATLPIAALTAWSALVTEGRLESGQTVLTLGTGGVSIWALQLAKAMGARVIITSSSDDKLARARELGADETINYKTNARWAEAVLEHTGGRGADVTVETVGAGTLNESMKATRAGGVISLLGALTGLQGDVNAGLILMKRLRIHGILVDSRAAFEQLNAFVAEHRVKPVIDRVFDFEQLPEAFRTMQAGEHFGKLVVRVKT